MPKFHVKHRITREQEREIDGSTAVHLIAPDGRVLALIPTRGDEAVSKAKERAKVIAEVLNAADAAERSAR